MYAIIWSYMRLCDELRDEFSRVYFKMTTDTWVLFQRAFILHKDPQVGAVWNHFVFLSEHINVSTYINRIIVYVRHFIKYVGLCLLLN